jgi:hypothetical protein
LAQDPVPAPIVETLLIETLDRYVSASNEPHYARREAGLPVAPDEKRRSWLDRVRNDISEVARRRR